MLLQAITVFPRFQKSDCLTYEYLTYEIYPILCHHSMGFIFYYQLFITIIILTIFIFIIMLLRFVYLFCFNYYCIFLFIY